jgi:hypothetical protein
MAAGNASARDRPAGVERNLSPRTGHLFRAELHVTAHSKRASLPLRPPSIPNSTTCLSEAHFEVDEAAAVAAAIEEAAAVVVAVHMLVVGKRQSARRRKTFWT